MQFVCLCWLLLLLSSEANAFAPTTHLGIQATLNAPTLQPRPHRMRCMGEKWPVTLPPGSPVFTRGDAIHERREASRVHRVEGLLHEICCALVYCDDMALLEREMLSSGPIWMDLSFSMARQPLLLRRTVADIAWRSGRPVSSPEHKWRVNPK